MVWFSLVYGIERPKVTLVTRDSVYSVGLRIISTTRGSLTCTDIVQCIVQWPLAFRLYRGAIISELFCVAFTVSRAIDVGDRNIQATSK